MAKVTTKLQVTVPKAVASRLGIRPGDEIDWRVEGGSARITRSGPARERSVAERLAIFDEATARQEQRNRARAAGRKERKAGSERGWTREDLYTRGSAR